MQINNILIRPVITEKATQLTGSNVYTFEVHLDANKAQITEALKSLYNVTIDSVKVITRKGKVRRVGKKMLSKQLPNKKIAYVKVASGSIDLFPKA